MKADIMNTLSPAIRHLTREELESGLPEIRRAPKDHGRLEAIVVRPGHNERKSLTSSEISPERGVHDDHWALGCWKTTEDGKPHPDVQICIMNVRVIRLIAQAKERWSLAGDNLFVDLDLTSENLPPGQRLAVGNALIEVTAVPHNGCQKFVERYGRDAVLFVNSPVGKQLHLRGIYARVVIAGTITVGDLLTKVD